LHETLATILQDPDWELDKDEAHRVAEGIEPFFRLANVQMTPKQAALTQAAFAVGPVYGPRLAKPLMALLRRWQGRPAPAPRPASVTPLRPAPSGVATPAHPGDPPAWPGAGPATGFTGAGTGINPPL
jgi:hypothetical protein